MSNFRYHPTSEFLKKLEKLERTDPPGYRRVQEAIDRLLENPQENDGKLQGPHRGRLKKYVGRSGHRLVYNWCASCRKANSHLQNACAFCEIIPDDSVVFYDLFSKNEAKKLGY